MSTVQKERQIFRRSARYLNKARRRYIRLIYPHVINNPAFLVSCAQKVTERGLYSAARSRSGGFTEGALASVRFAILRAMFKMEGNKRASWHAWILRHGFRLYSFLPVPNVKEKTA